VCWSDWRDKILLGLLLRGVDKKVGILLCRSCHLLLLLNILSNLLQALLIYSLLSCCTTHILLLRFAFLAWSLRRNWRLLLGRLSNRSRWLSSLTWLWYLLRSWWCLTTIYYDRRLYLYWW